MSSAHQAWLFAALVTASGFSYAANQSESICTHPDNPQARSVSVEYEQDASLVPCRVVYVRDGETTYPAQAQNSIGHCEKVEQKIVSNLQSAGYSCNTSFIGSTLTRDKSVVLDLFTTDQQEQESFVLASRELDSESVANRYIAQFKRIYPNVAARLARNTRADTWHMVLGQLPDQQQLEDSLALLAQGIQDQFQIVSASDSNTVEGAIDAIQKAGFEFQPDGWMPFAILNCYNAGRTSTRSLSACANLTVDEATFASCLGGGPCNPGQLTRPKDVAVFDLLETFGDADPVDVARGIVVNQVGACRAANASADEFTDCAMQSVLPDSAMDLYACRQNTSDALSLVRCAADDDLVTQIDQMVACSESQSSASSCLLARSGHPALVQSAACLAMDTPEAIAECAVQNNLVAADADTVACLANAATDGSLSDIGCITTTVLSDSQRAMLSCAVASGTSADKALCLARDSGQFDQHHFASLECMSGKDTLATTEVANCLGGQYLSEDINACLAHGIHDSRCFQPVSSVAMAIQEPMDAIDQLAGVGELKALRDSLGALSSDPVGAVMSNAGVSDVAAELEQLVETRPGDVLQEVTEDTASKLDEAAEKLKSGFSDLFKR